LATPAIKVECAARARLMRVGERPRDREDLVGRPFVGPAGRLLDQALLALGCTRDQRHIADAVKHFEHELRGDAPSRGRWRIRRWRRRSSRPHEPGASASSRALSDAGAPCRMPVASAFSPA
jgi:DNA polymerase